MNAFVTLSYGDRRALVNTLRALARKPGRAVMWALYALAIIAFAVLKTGPWARRPGGVPPPFALEISDLWVCGLTIAFGVVLATGTARWLGVFSSRAEALVLMRADAAPVTVAAYLQLRAVAAALAQGIARFAYLIVFGLPGGATLAALAAQLVFFAAAGAAVASVALPRALARGGTRAAMIARGMDDRARGRVSADRRRVAHRTAPVVGRAVAPHPGRASRLGARRARAWRPACHRISHRHRCLRDGGVRVRCARRVPGALHDLAREPRLARARAHAARPARRGRLRRLA